MATRKHNLCAKRQACAVRLSALLYGALELTGENMMKNCMFQYATNQRILADTDLITQDEALELFNKNKADYIERVENEENPQMCIWVNCDTNASYGETLHNWHAEDFKVIDGELWQKV